MSRGLVLIDDNSFIRAIRKDEKRMEIDEPEKVMIRRPSAGVIPRALPPLEPECAVIDVDMAHM
jgi:hypothetical protein